MVDLTRPRAATRIETELRARYDALMVMALFMAAAIHVLT